MLQPRFSLTHGFQRRDSIHVEGLCARSVAPLAVLVPAVVAAVVAHGQLGWLSRADVLGGLPIVESQRERDERCCATGTCRLDAVLL